jgi:hypothetical protein
MMFWARRSVEHSRRRRRLALLAPLGLAALLVAEGAPLRAQSQVDVLLYGSSLSYSAASREDGYSAGIYGTCGAGWSHLVEAGGTLTRIRYLDGDRLDQANVALAYGRFWARGSARVGAHLVESSDPLSDGGIIIFGGAGAYRPGVWSVGAEASLSHYGRYDGGLTAVQVTPAAGFTTGHADGAGLVGLVVRGYYIQLSTDAGLGDRSYLSAEAAASLTLRSVTLSGTAWVGEQAFAVRNAGFLVFNLAEVHTGGYGGGLRWVVAPRAAVSAGLYVERFSDFELGTSGSSRSLSAALGITL